MKENFSSEDCFNNAFRYYCNKDYNKALKYLDKAIALSELYREAYDYKAMIYRTIENYYKAIEVYTEKIEIFENQNNSNEDLDDYIHTYLNRAIVYRIIGDYDKEINAYLKVEKLCLKYNKIDKIKNIYNHIGYSYYYKGEYNKAIERFNIVINEIDKENNNIAIDAHLGKGMVYLTLEEYDKAIENFELVIKNNEGSANNLSRIAHGYKSMIYIIKNNIENAKKEILFIKNFNKQFNTYKIDFSNIYIPLSFKYIENNKYEEVKKFYNLIDEIYKEKDFLDNTEIEQIGELNKEIENLIDDDLGKLIENIFINNNFIHLFSYKEKFAIWRLCLEIQNLLQSCKIDFNNEDYVYHYTKTTNLKLMLTSKGDVGKLRLNNIIHMNDPQEGKLLKDLFFKIDNQNENKIRKNKLKNIFNESYRDFVYLSSFSEKNKFNELPMWVHYGDGGKGIGLKFGHKFFKNKAVYRVQYLDIEKFNIYESKQDVIEKLKQIKGSNEINELIEKLEKEERLKLNLKEIFNIISDEIFIDNKNIEFNNLINNLIDYISVLFKDNSYEYEKEVRCIKIFLGKPEINDNLDIPRTYINFNEITNETCEGVIAGPKANYDEILAYCKYKGIKEVIKSEIKYT